MAQKSRPDPSGGNIVNADEYEALALSYIADGVYGHPSDPPVVYGDSTGRRVKVRPGKRANVRGYEWYSDPTADEIIDNLPANTSTFNRIDRLVLRLDRSTRTIRTQYLQGTPAQTPSPAALTQDVGNSSGLFDFPLARWQVAPGYTTVAAGDIVTEAWYPQPAGPILCNSTSRPFGAFVYNGMEILEIDTSLKQQWTGAVWRRAPWNEPWGVIGGKRYMGAPPLANGIGATELYVNMDTGPVTLVPGRSHRWMARVFATSNANVVDYWILRLRRTNASGAQVAEQVIRTDQNTFGATFEFQSDHPDIGVDPITDTWVLTVQRLTGGSSVVNIARSGINSAYVLVEDKGPISRITAL